MTNTVIKSASEPDIDECIASLEFRIWSDNISLNGKEELDQALNHIRGKLNQFPNHGPRRKATRSIEATLLPVS